MVRVSHLTRQRINTMRDERGYLSVDEMINAGVGRAARKGDPLGVGGVGKRVAELDGGTGRELRMPRLPQALCAGEDPAASGCAEPDERAVDMPRLLPAMDRGAHECAVGRPLGRARRGMSKRQRRKKMERRLAKNPDRLHDHMTNQARTDRLLDAMRVEGGSVGRSPCRPN